jgi:hypothetical protein
MVSKDVGGAQEYDVLWRREVLLTDLARNSLLERLTELDRPSPTIPSSLLVSAAVAASVQ